MISRKVIVLALACAAIVALGSVQPAQAGGKSSTDTGIYGASDDYQSAEQHADGGVPATANPGPPPPAPVPEPGTMTLVALGLYGLHRRLSKTNRP